MYLLRLSGHTPLVIHMVPLNCVRCKALTMWLVTGGPFINGGQFLPVREFPVVDDAS